MQMSRPGRWIQDPARICWNDSGKATILRVTHDAFSASYAKDVYILNDGLISCKLSRGENRREFYDKIIDMQASMGGDFS